MADTSLSTIEDNSEYVLYRCTVEREGQTVISKIRDGTLEGTTVTLPVTFESGGSVDTENLTLQVSGGLSAEGGYVAQENANQFILLLWYGSTGMANQTIYVIEDEYAYNPETLPKPIDEYAAYSDADSALDSLRYRIGRQLAPIVDNIKQSRLSNDWVTVLRDDEVVEVAVDVEPPLKLVAVSVAVEVRVFIVTDEEVDGEEREVVKRFSYAPPFPVTANGVEIETDDGLSIIAPRCELDEMAMRPFRVTHFS